VRWRACENHNAKNSVFVDQGENCQVQEYKLDTELDCAIVSVKGRYPLEGKVLNQQCKEMAYVVKGKVNITIKDTVFELSAGDAVLIEPEEVYHWEGDLELFISCNPAWSPEQHVVLKFEKNSSDLYSKIEF